jgi:hypothetical protein
MEITFEVTATVEGWFALGQAVHDNGTNSELDEIITAAAWHLLAGDPSRRVTVRLPLELIPALGEAADIVLADPEAYANPKP